MKTRTIASLGLSALVLGGAMVGCTATHQGGIASSGSREAAVAAKLAARHADSARKALARDPAIAVAKAESAVALMPQNAYYRALLGQGYLKAGRFASARTAFTDSLALQPGDGRTALNLALSHIALGDWQAARATLDAHSAVISTADRGLALALAGDPAGAAQLLTDVVRSGEGTPKTRQNLALALALAGQWQGARVVASADMAPADVDARLQQWAAFANPRSSADQVASLLGVRPVADAGQPVALALSAPAPIGTAVAAVEPATEAAPVDVAQAAPQADVQVAEQVLAAGAKPAPLLRADTRAVKVKLAAVSTTPVGAKGNWFVQVGAYENAAVARDGWKRATRRMPALAQHIPTGARFAGKSGAFYRLAVGGFARGDADAFCRRYRASGGACFVRAAAGDQMASWARPVQVAARKLKPIQLASR